MDENEIVEAPTVAETPDTPAVETPKETFDQTMQRVADEAYDGKRGPDGKFQPKVEAPGAPEGTEVPGSPQAAPPDPAQPVIEAPQSLPADVKAEWKSFSPKAQQWLAQREGEIHQRFTTDGERLKSLSAFEEVTRPLESRLKQLNAPAPEYFRRLAAADQLLATDGVRGLQQIAQMYGIDLHAALNGNPQGPTPTQPNVEALVEEKLGAYLQQQRVEASTSEINKFKAALPTDEQADFDKLDPLMSALFQANPKWTLSDLYKAARRADPDTLARDEAKKSAEAQKKAEEEAKKKAAQDARLSPLSRRPGSTPTGPIKGKTYLETMERVADDVFARQ